MAHVCFRCPSLLVVMPPPHLARQMAARRQRGGVVQAPARPGPPLPKSKGELALETALDALDAEEPAGPGEKKEGPAQGCFGGSREALHMGVPHPLVSRCI